VIAGGGFAAAGCTEEPAEATTKPGPALTEAGIEAKNFFIERLFDGANGLKERCGACHSGTGGGGSTFLGPDAETSYGRIESSVGLIAEPSRSPLIMHLHSDKALAAQITPGLRSGLTQWLNLEATARGLTGGKRSTLTLAEAYKEYADCMNFTLWTQYRVGDLAFSQTDLEGPCLGCHSTGQGGAYLAPAPREFFEKSKQFPFIQKFVVGKVDADGNFEKLIPANRFVDKANELCTEGKVDCHPVYGLPPVVAENITAFILTTLQNLAGGTCETGVLPILVEDAGKDGG
jgi:mono/diheme cytochrome c family protein